MFFATELKWSDLLDIYGFGFVSAVGYTNEYTTVDFVVSKYETNPN